MLDYREGEIYKIWDNMFSKCYMGSTCESLSKRMTKHRDKLQIMCERTLRVYNFVFVV